MQDPKRADYFMKWKYSSMVPDPLEQMSCNFCPKSAPQHSTFPYIKKVFKSQDAKKISPEKAQEYKIATSEKHVKNASALFPPLTVELDMALIILSLCTSDPPPPVGRTLNLLHFLVAVFRVFYGKFTSMDYPELKINILDLLLRYTEMHPQS
jgi:hypothetical protein